MILARISSVFLIFSLVSCKNETEKNNTAVKNKDIVTIDDSVWNAPDTSKIPNDEFGKLVRYGRDLIINTAYYIGPEGKVGKYLGNKMNCTQCHQEAGTKAYALSFFSTHARYPQYRARENKILSLADRINNCIERPHNGKHLLLNSKEMLAITCYIKWLGEKVPVNGRVKGDGPIEIIFPKRAADPTKGSNIYNKHCSSCHGIDGEGKMRADNICYEYPPLWGNQSYQAGSSVHRIIKMGAFVYANMPYKLSTYKNPQLTIEEAYDVVAFINNDTIHKRPKPITKSDYEKIENKPIDYDRGPYIDPFSEKQHKYGPYQEIIDFYIQKGKKPNY